MKISTGSNSSVLISVYLPYQCPDNEVEYLEKLGFISALTNESESESERYLFDPHKKLIQSNNEKQLGSGDPY